jgi:hypothetical protein
MKSLWRKPSALAGLTVSSSESTTIDIVESLLHGKMTALGRTPTNSVWRRLPGMAG